MRSILPLAALFSVSFFVGAGALAQKAITLAPAVEAHKVELEPAADGGVRLTVYARAESAEGVVLERPVTCESSQLTAAQRSALTTIRTAARACWNANALDGGL